MLGIARRAGKVVSGEVSVEKAVKAGKAYLVIVAEDVSDNTRKNFTDMCTYYKLPLIFVGTKETLGHAIGCELRASAAVTDSGLAKSIEECAKASGESFSPIG
ncbi:MAG: L7Ae/L30e/S12e/Gadd45 family ribosomal protein [Lachnospiraceae bacterium]